MNNKTYSRRLQQLISQLENHTHRDEIIKLATEQLLDDATLVETSSDVE